MTPADLERLAEACERAAKALLVHDGYVRERDMIAGIVLRKDAKQLTELSRAIRAGRVTVKEED